MSLNVRDYNNKDKLLFPSAIGDYLSKDHLAWIIDEVVDQLDLSCLYRKVPSVGNPSYHPKMMLKILFYGYAASNFSSRKITKGLETDVAFIFLSGMQKPDFRTISDFRKNNTEALSHLFVQIVRLCKQLGLVGLGHISLDSTVIKANAYREKTYDREKLILEEKAVEKKIKELLDEASATDDEEDRIFGISSRGDEIPKELRSQEKRLEKLKEAKARLEEESLKEINFTDPDVKFQRQEGNLIRPGYRAEVAVDEKEQIILSCDVINKANDVDQLIPLIKQTGDNLPEFSIKESIIVTADSGYSSMENLKELESRQNIDAYIPDPKYQTAQNGKTTPEDLPFYKGRFIYDPKKDVYLCPNHKELYFSHRKKEQGEHGAYSSIYRCRECRNCRYFGRCTKTTHGREIKIYDNTNQIYKMRNKLNTADGKRIYGRRKVIVEPVFGNIKYNLGFRQFLLRGLKKVKAEFTLMAIVHNIKKMAKALRKTLTFKPPGIQLAFLPAT